VPEDYTGGTFAISNLGMYGVSSFCPIINPPQAAILGAGMTAPQVVIDKDGTPKQVELPNNAPDFDCIITI
jgi:pyruvate dehydrogenase E2 component (dihydrolipoamide acetyltransferase)